MRKLSLVVMSLFALALSPMAMADTADDVSQLLKELKKAQTGNNVIKFKQFGANLSSSASKLAKVAASASGNAAASMQAAAQNLQAAAAAASAGDLAGAIAILETSRATIIAGLRAAGTIDPTISASLLTGNTTTTATTNAIAATGLIAAAPAIIELNKIEQQLLQEDENLHGGSGN